MPQRAERKPIPLFLRVRLDTHKRRKRFDPNNEEAEANQAFWRLQDVMVWIMWRDLSIVQELAEREKTTQNTLAAASALDGLSGVKVAIPRPGDAFRKISIAAQNHQIVAGGEEPESGRLKEIPAIEWRRLEPSERLDALLSPDRREAFRKPLFDRAAVMSRWPEPSRDIHRKKEAAPLWQQIIDAKRNNPELRRGDLRAMFNGASDGQFERAWLIAREKLPALKKAGRPKNPHFK